MLYKYFTVDEYSISNLIRNELYCRNYKAFNDPFECWFILKEGSPDPEKEPDRFEKICQIWGYEKESDDAFYDSYYLYMEELESYQPDIKKILDGSRISCFSKEIDNLLMWSHYADGLRGFCLEFDESLMLSVDTDKEASIIPVLYAEEPPIVDKMLYSLANDQIWFNEMALNEEPSSSYHQDYEEGIKDAEQLLDALYTKTIATKPIQWKYEEEIRLVFNSKEASKGEYFKYPPEAIKGIIFGERMDIKVKETLLQIIEAKKIPIEKKIALRNSETYKIKFESLY
ncbi:MAG: DUF2971 domain-containing protein [Prolixibacteraceae bacterium]|nr:DUF2971 domain-containing protein [Prolixibacteraceae bacterium]